MFGLRIERSPTGALWAWMPYRTTREERGFYPLGNLTADPPNPSYSALGIGINDWHIWPTYSLETCTYRID